MKYIIKLFSEITIKSKSVRLYFIRILKKHILIILKTYDFNVLVIEHWDYIEVITTLPDINNNRSLIFSKLSNIPGIHSILLVKEYIWKDICDIYEKVKNIFEKKIIQQSFCIRVKRKGKHMFNSHDIECYIGEKFKKNILGSCVKLKNPNIIIFLEIKDNYLLIVLDKVQGLGGFPVGSQNTVLSLISGGFDSSVSSYMLIRRGCCVNYCFFNFGTDKHVINVYKIIYHIWNKYSSFYNAKIFSIDFISVFNIIMETVSSSYRSIVLKRAMLKIASNIADKYKISTLITGDSIGQVSTQTLNNLYLANQITDKMILRPLISYDKETIIDISRVIGTEPMSKKIREYCGLISYRPTVSAVKKKLLIEEEKINYILTDVIQKKIKIFFVKDILKKIEVKFYNIVHIIKETSIIDLDDVVIDIRSLEEQNDRPLILSDNIIKIIPFYKLETECINLDKKASYILYCNNGILSYVKALYMKQEGFLNIKIYKKM